MFLESDKCHSSLLTPTINIVEFNKMVENL